MDRHDDTTPPRELDDDDREFLESVAYGQRRGFSPFDLLEHAMSGDDTTPPFAGHGFAFDEPYPLNASDRIAALQRKCDELAAEVLRLRQPQAIHASHSHDRTKSLIDNDQAGGNRAG